MVVVPSLRKKPSPGLVPIVQAWQDDALSTVSLFAFNLHMPSHAPKSKLQLLHGENELISAPLVIKAARICSVRSHDGPGCEILCIESNVASLLDQAVPGSPFESQLRKLEDQPFFYAIWESIQCGFPHKS